MYPSNQFSICIEYLLWEEYNVFYQSWELSPKCWEEGILRTKCNWNHYTWKGAFLLCSCLKSFLKIKLDGAANAYWKEMNKYSTWVLRSKEYSVSTNNFLKMSQCKCSIYYWIIVWVKSFMVWESWKIITYFSPCRKLFVKLVK